MTTFRFLNFELHTSLEQLDFSKTPILVNTINPHSYCVTKKDKLFCEALEKSDILIPDGMGIVWAAKLLSGEIINRITGADLHRFLLTKLNHTEGKVFYLGSSSSVLEKFEDPFKKEFPNIKFAG